MEPGLILKLDENVVNKIAAGEVIQRPCSALKELIENSIDAKATNIQINVKSGGLKFLQIQDNGTGIRKENMAIVCERFTTSKLNTFDDLSTISTYGFRGEALASISHVAHLTIQTKTALEKCAYKGTYQDGKLIGALKLVAGNQGTQITIEDLFYNTKQRLQALNLPNVEYQKLSDIVMKYAVHNSSIGFGLRKVGDSKQLKTPPNSTINKNVGLLYGSEVCKNLIECSLDDGEHGFKMSSVFTNPNYAAKKHVFILFINHRLVESKNLKQAIDEVFAVYLAKEKNPFVYLSIEMEPSHVDVNIHPTKHEVRFLYEDEIINKIRQCLMDRLLNGNDTRKLVMQSQCPKTMNVSQAIEKKANMSSEQKIYDKNLVRCDSKLQKIELFFGAPKGTMKNCCVMEDSTSHVSFNETIRNGGKAMASIELSEDSSDSDEPMTSNGKQHDIKDLPLRFISMPNVDTNGDTNDNQNDDQNDDTNDKQNDDQNDDTHNDTNDELSENIHKFKNDSDGPGPTLSDSVENIFNLEKTITENDESPSMKMEKEDVSAQPQPSISSFQKRENIEKIDRADSFIKSNDFKIETYARREMKLTSILQLRKTLESKCHTGLRKIINNSVFVGCISCTYSLIQHETGLFMINTKLLSAKLFYQILLYEFGNFGSITLSEPLSIRSLALIALNTKSSGWTLNDGPKDDLAASVEEILVSKAAMLKEYFSLHISEDGMLHSIPLLLVNYMPPLWYLPMYVLRLASEVDWDNEKKCFKTFSRETATFYAETNESMPEKEWKWTSEYVLYTSIKKYLLPPKSFLTNKSFFQIATLTNLYKIFERC